MVANELGGLMMTKYIALLRGVNVGGKNKVVMADLKSSFERQGFHNVVCLPLWKCSGRPQEKTDGHRPPLRVIFVIGPSNIVGAAFGRPALTLAYKETELTKISCAIKRRNLWTQRKLEQ